MKRPLLSLSTKALSDVLKSENRSRQVWRCLQRGINPFQEPTLPAGISKELSESFFLTPYEVEYSSTSQEHEPVKILLRFLSGDAVECVLIPMKTRTTLCISSQVGCARGCSFCLTGTMGLKRNLKLDEILIQVFSALTLCKEKKFPSLRNIVFMGMGEPLDNFSNIKCAIDVLTSAQGFGFAPKHITLSTVGPSVTSIDKCKDLKCNIAWSIHASNDALRDAFIPRTKESMQEKRDAFLTLIERHKKILFAEVTLISGVNDGLSAAQDLANFLRPFGKNVRINLIPCNPGVDSYFPSSSAQCEKFQALLREQGFFTTLRKTRGRESSAACGQLVTQETEL